jgi:hypothetical protein
MTAKEKAEKLVDSFINRTRNRFERDAMSYRRAKVCALIAVDEISWILNELDHHNDVESEMYFYNEVKQEIEKL